MRKLKVVQIGIRHEHAKGKFQTLKKLPDAFELAGMVDEAEFARTPTYLSPKDATFELYKDEKFLTLDEVFRMTDLDAVLVEVPNLDLVPVAMRFAERGIPLHVDKPCGEDLGRYKQLLDLAEARNIPFQMGYVFRYNPAIRFAVDAVKSGMLGSVFMVETNMNHSYGGEPYQQYLTAFKGGVMFNLGCHLIDFLVEMLGRPEQVVSLLKGCEPGDPAFSNTLAVLEYPHTHAVVAVASRDRMQKRRLRVEGTNGTLELCPMESFTGKGLEIALKLKEDFGAYRAGEQTVGFPPEYDRYAAQLLDFSAVIQGEARDRYTRQHDYTVHEVTLAAAGYIQL
ncbi:MAG: Gfo/Idh/MocA family oxidoreductase [Lentisphaeria bacterium]|nr:Gfo/Idh/MocA family oxidoreductase [Lentisphaeria bacterium]